MEKALEFSLTELSKMATPIKNDEEIKNIATVSASGDQEVGEKLLEAFKKAKKEALITIETGQKNETTIETVEGIEFDRGYLSAYFCTNLEKLTAELLNPLILITDKKISSIQEILPILQTVAATSKELVIIADDIEGEALSTLVINKLKGTLKVTAVKAPGYGEERKAFLEDLAVLTGAEVISEEKGDSFKEITSEVLGKAEKILVSKEKTLIIDGKGSKKDIQARLKALEKEIEKTANSYDREKLEKRKAKFSGCVVIVHVGGLSEAIVKQKKQLFEDSLNATKAALEDGVVIGGGTAFLQLAEKLKSLALPEEEILGRNLFISACFIPTRQIISNAGFDGSTLIEEILKKGKDFGFNALSEKIEDLIKTGVVDPVKVLKQSLTHAVSVAGVVLLSEALIGDAVEEKK
jgi:chaperonin GroEL